MTTRKQQQLAAVRDLAKHSGKSIAEVAAKFGGATGLGALEVAALAHEAAQQPEPMHPVARAALQRKAGEADAKAAVSQAVTDVRAWRAYESAAKTNPFAAAQVRLTHGNAALERGRLLNQDTDDSGPEAA